MIAFACPHCARDLRVKDELAGKSGKCPGCGQALTIPTASATLPATVAEAARRAAGRRPAGDADPARAPGAHCHGATLASNAAVGAPAPADACNGDTVGAGPREGKHPAELTDFLAPAQAADEIGRLGPYRVLAVLGHGGMGVVFRAEDPGLQRLVALKAMLPARAMGATSQQRFLREARAAAAVKDDHVVTIFQVGEDRGVPFVAMEFLEGEPLDVRLQRGPKLSPAEIARIGHETVLGLAAAHQRGLIHRDIKPANLWLEGARGRVKILDFGLARALADETHLTQTGAVVGTPAYMAPEQAGGGALDPRCDLFSLGCVLYRLCTGETPFKGKDTLAIISALALVTPPAPQTLDPAVPSALSELVMRLLAKNPADRPGTAQEVAAALAALAQDETVALPRPGKGVRPPRPGGGSQARAAAGKRRWPVLVVAAALVLLVGVAMAAVFTLQTRHGTLVVKVAEPDVQVFIDGEARVVVDSKKVGRLELIPGEHHLTVKRGAEELFTKSFSLKSGGEVVIEATWTPKAQLGAMPPRFTNSLGMEFVLVGKGTAWLGGGGGRPGHKKVAIADAFYLGVFEVTQGEWQAVTGLTPSHFSRTGKGKDLVKGIADAELKRFPVESVSWDDAQGFLTRLNARLKEPGWLYRLPTKAEWEYACRGGPVGDRFESAYDFYLQKPTNQLQPEQANFDKSGWKRPCKVGSYAPNRLGLYDMHGNVSEWCADESPPAPKDPKGAPQRDTRGGGWVHDAGLCRASIRDASESGSRSYYCGLRLARVPVGKENK